MTQLHPELHARLGWRPATGFAFARRMATVPLATAEIARVSQVMPVVFHKVGEHWQVVAVMGPVHGANVYVSREGKWHGTYVPALLRVYPFRLVDTDRLGLWPDYEPLPLASEGAHPFYEDGELTPLLQQTLGFLLAAQAGIKAAHLDLEALEALGALTPWEVQSIDNPQPERELTGLYALYLPRFEGFEDAVVIRHFRNGSLRLMYAHLLSLHLADRFKQLSKAIVAPETTAPRQPEKIDKAADFIAAITNDLGDAEV